MHSVSVRSRHGVMGCNSLCFKSHRAVQTKAADNPTEGLCLCTDTVDLHCLSPPTGTPWAMITAKGNHLCTKPGQGWGSVWNVCDPAPTTHNFCCLFSGFSFTVFIPNLLINKGGSPSPPTHTSLSGSINNSRGHHWDFSDFLKVWSHTAVGSLKRNMLSMSRGWIPSS